MWLLHQRVASAFLRSSAMYGAFVNIAISLAAALFTEGASWYLIYRKEDYQRLKKTIESLQSKGPTRSSHSTHCN